ncbi:MAG: hypothetical protein BWK80_42660 [Desulfobacteraceae bacterium IS3]|nr:MAG: hypothetical protein BWK80_42660 [Desulfobacteraceae bacterium IS3]
MIVYNHKKKMPRTKIYIRRKQMKKTGCLLRLPQFFTGWGLSGFVLILMILTAAVIVPSLSYGFEVKPERVRSVGNLYERPEISSRVIAELRNGDSVTLIHQHNEWYVVKLTDNRLGWANESLFSDKNESTAQSVPDKKAETASAKDTEGRKLVLEAAIGRIREMPSLESEVKFTLKKGNTVSLIKTQGDWYFIRLDDGSTGWASRRLFSESPADPETASKPSADPETASKSSADPKPADPQSASKSSADPKPIESEISLKPEIVEPKPSESEPDMPKTVKEIRADLTSEGEEKVLVSLNGFYPPETFVLEERIPKIVCDFPDTVLGKGIKHPIEVNGKFIQRIRIGFHEGSASRLRIVLDLVPDQEYVVERTFFQKENLYILTVKPAVNDKPKSEK